MLTGSQADRNGTMCLNNPRGDEGCGARPPGGTRGPGKGIIVTRTRSVTRLPARLPETESLGVEPQRPAPRRGPRIRDVPAPSLRSPQLSFDASSLGRFPDTLSSCAGLSHE